MSEQETNEGRRGIDRLIPLRVWGGGTLFVDPARVAQIRPAGGDAVGRAVIVTDDEHAEIVEMSPTEAYSKLETVCAPLCTAAAAAVRHFREASAAVGVHQMQATWAAASDAIAALDGALRRLDCSGAPASTSAEDKA